LRIALFVDGPSDRDTLKVLAKKLLAQRDPTPGLEFRVLPRGDFFSSAKISAYLNDLRRTHPDANKAILCLDCECSPREDVQPKLLDVQQDIRREHPSLNPTFVLKVHALEGWLASDSQALAEVLGTDPAPYPKPEGVCKPKGLLAEVFKKANKEFDYMRDDPRIAEAADIERLCQASPSFSEFRNAIEDP
jgi:hypothetical protein